MRECIGHHLLLAHDGIAWRADVPRLIEWEGGLLQREISYRGTRTRHSTIIDKGKPGEDPNTTA